MRAVVGEGRGNMKSQQPEKEEDGSGRLRKVRSPVTPLQLTTIQILEERATEITTVAR